MSMMAGAAIGQAMVLGKGARPELTWTIWFYSSRTDRSLTPRCLKMMTTGEWHF